MGARISIFDVIYSWLSDNYVISLSLAVLLLLSASLRVVHFCSRNESLASEERERERGKKSEKSFGMVN